MINIHPYRIKTQPGFIESVLKIINNFGDQVLRTTPKSIIDNISNETLLPPKGE